MTEAATGQQQELALDVAAGIGAGLLANAATAADAVETTLRIARGAGLRDVGAVASHNELQVRHRAPGQPQTIRIEVFRERAFNYGRQTALKNLAQRVTDRQLTLEQAAVELREVVGGQGPYPVWLTRLFTGCAGASAAVLFGGNWLVALVAFFANMLLDWLFGVLGGRGWPTFFLQVVAGFVAQLAAIGVTHLDPRVDGSVVVVAVILVMFCGMTSTGAVTDAITGWALTAVGRITEALVNTLGLVVGIRAGLVLAGKLGLDLTLSPNVSMASFPLAGLMLACAFVGAAFSLVAQSPLRVVPATACLSAVCWAVYSLAGRAGVSSSWATAAAALVAGAVGVVLARWLRACVDGFAIASILPLVPGINLYQGLWNLSQGIEKASPGFFTAGTVALALAAGVTFGEYLGSVAMHRLHRAYDHLVPVFRGPRTQRGAAQTSR